MKALCAVAALFVVVSPAFAQSTTSYEIYKEDVRKIVEANLSGRLRLAKGDNLGTSPASGRSRGPHTRGNRNTS